MKKLNKNKSVDRAIDDVRKAILDQNKKKRTKVRSKIPNSMNDDVLLLTEVYDPNNIKYDNKVLIFKRNIKNLIKQDIEEWFENNFLLIAKNNTKDAIQSLNIKNY